MAKSTIRTETLSEKRRSEDNQMDKLNKITVGIALNKLRAMQRNFDFWMSKRAQYPFYAGVWQQEMAEKECLRLGPAIISLRQQIEEYDRAKRNT